MRITTTYDKVKATAERKVSCPGCGKPRTVRRTFARTVNPFNRTDDGRPKTRREVQESVNAQAMEWEPDEIDLWHGKCMRTKIA